MKRKIVNAIPQKKPTSKSSKMYVATVQKEGDILILDIYKDKTYIGRYCTNVETYEYEIYKEKDKTWTKSKIFALLDFDRWDYYESFLREKIKFNSEEEKQVVEAAFPKIYIRDAWSKICHAADEYSSDKRERAYDSKVRRINNLMDSVPKLPNDLAEWLYKTVSKTEYCFQNKGKQLYTTTCCGKTITDEEFGPNKIKHNDYVTCPHCKTKLQVKTRVQRIEEKTRFMLAQKIDEERGVARHFKASVVWEGDSHNIYIDEQVRIMLHKGNLRKKGACQLFYAQENRGFRLRKYSNGCIIEDVDWWDSNPKNKTTGICCIYPLGIKEALEGTVYEEWSRIFTDMAAKGQRANYNSLMRYYSKNNVGVIEYLFKGRFYKLVEETSKNIQWTTTINTSGRCIETVLQIKDRQRINRLRELNGGVTILEWMQWSDKNNQKIAQEVLEWLTENNISRSDVQFIEKKMRIGQIMNYVKRQQETSYIGMSASQVLSQWNDYLRMCNRLKKKVDDEMIYRPRELKRRHDDAVDEINKQNIIEDMNRNPEILKRKAKEMSEKFPGAEDILKAIKPKLEYQSDEYIIVVPNRLVDIMMDGQALHHCAGATDRYFDRIKSQETYICFLRHAAEPNVPYYTIEVEPGGTIRQHRGYLDEEPNIEVIKPFLKEWQRVIKKRLNKKDEELAAISAVKRQENIEELKRKNNLKVLNALMEDFMEAV